jgi:hypothetical protein
VDPATLPMSFLERVEIERWPGLLRVYLFTRRNESPAARSRVAVASGDRNIARYEGALETRSPRGPGLVLAGEYLSVGLGSAPGITDYSNTHYWLQGSWQRSARFGVMYQLVQQSPGRRLLIRAAGDTIGGSLKGKRSDALGRVFLQTRADGTGPRLDLLYGRSSWSGSRVDQAVTQGGLAANFRRPTYQLGGSAMLRSQWTTLDLRGQGGWTPLPQLSASGEIVHQEHDGGRQSDWVGVRGGLSLPLALSLSGAARVGKAVSAPAILSDVAQDLRDYSATLSWQQRVVGFELGVNRTAAFAPQAYQSFLRVDSLRALPATTWVTASVRIQPQPWITLESWYSNASTGTPDGIPPHHSLTTGTIHSNFLRQFPSGIFDLKLQMAAEAFSSGIIGLGGAGQPIRIGGATFYRSLVEVRLGGFVAYWDRVNLRGERRGYVPGYDFPALGSTYGVRWEFVN